MSDDWEEDEEDWEREGYEYGDDSDYYSEQGDSDKDFRAAELKEETFRGISEGILVKLFGEIWTIRNFRAWESLITYRMRKTLVYVPKLSFLFRLKIRDVSRLIYLNLGRYFLR